MLISNNVYQKLISETFKVGHYLTVSETIGRLNKVLNDDRRVAGDYNMLSQDLTP